MTQDAEPMTDDAPPPAWRRLWRALAMVAIVVVGLAGGLVILGLSGQSLPLPGAATRMIETRANQALDGGARLRIGGGDLVVGPDFLPHVRLEDVVLVSPSKHELAKAASVEAAFDMSSLLDGRLEARHFRADRVRLAIRREVDGSLEFALGLQGFTGGALRPADVIDAIDRAFGLPALRRLEDVSVTDLSVLFDDRRAGQTWSLPGGSLTLTQTDRALKSEARFTLSEPAEVARQVAHDPDAGPQPDMTATVSMALQTDKTSSAATGSLTIADMPARDLALALPAVVWLNAVDAPLSGEFTTALDEAGDLLPLTGHLALGQGAIRPNRTIRPVPFDAARLDLSFRPDDQSLTLTDVAVDSPALRARASAKGWLKGAEHGLPTALVGQVQLSDLQLAKGPLFASDMAFGRAMADFKLDLTPFRLTVGQFALLDQGTRIGGKARIEAGLSGWSIAVDTDAERLDSARLLALWPLPVAPHAREWLAREMSGGTLTDVRAAIRTAPERQPVFEVGFRFENLGLRFLPDMPPVEGGRGFGAISGNAFALTAEGGRLTPPTGGSLDIAGSVLSIRDIFHPPGWLSLDARLAGPIPAGLSLIDRPPLSLMTKAGKPTDLAQGNGTAAFRMTLPMVHRPRADMFDWQVSADLGPLTTTKIVPNRTLSADHLRLEATKRGIRIEGPARIDGVPLAGAWTQSFAPSDQGKSRVEGTVDITPDALQTFHIQLPKGAVAGQGKGAFTLDLTKGQPPAFRLESTLSGLALALPDVGWSKAAGTPGHFAVAGRFTRPIAISELAIDAGGLSGKGSLTLRDDGGMAEARFAGLRIADWFKGDVTLTGRGKGAPPAIAITAGTLDAPRAPFASGQEMRPSVAAGAPLSVALDRLTLAPGLDLQGFRGTFATGGGLAGDFTGAINGRAALTGRIGRTDAGQTVIRLWSDDAGAALAAAGIYASGRGGRMGLTLSPRGPKGTYDGALAIKDIRVVNAPALAGLLDAISVVGLIQQLQGEGIWFSDVTGRFTLTPGAVEITRGSAVGASLGVSAAGVYRMSDHWLDLQGTISPIYLLNGVGQIFSRQRDGLFGFNYTIQGPKDAPHTRVNPLSILTPGLFRDLFRKAPATLDSLPAP